MTDQVQNPDVIIQMPRTISDIRPNNLSLHTLDSKVFDQRPSLQTLESKTFDQRHSDSDRQHPDEHVLNCPPRKHDAKWWAYRILVGRDYYEVQAERTKRRSIDFLTHEVRYHLAEFVGTFFLVFFIAGIQVNQDMFPEGGVANIDKGLVSGFILTGLIYCFGKVSGAHFNPCVTLAFFLRGSFGFFRTITYIAVQFGGAVSGAAVLYHFFGNVGPGLGTTLPAPGLENKYAVEIEILITFVLITVILTTTKKAQLLSAIAGLAVGSTFGAIEIFAWNYTGASVNPWRSIGPTMISGVGWDTYWIYVVGPLCGTILAVILERIMAIGADPEEKAEHHGGHGYSRHSDRMTDGSLAQSKIRYR